MGRKKKIVETTPVKQKKVGSQVKYTVYCYSKSRFRLYLTFVENADASDTDLLQQAIVKVKEFSKEYNYTYNKRITDIRIMERGLSKKIV